MKLKRLISRSLALPLLLLTIVLIFLHHLFRAPVALIEFTGLVVATSTKSILNWGE